MKRIFLFTCLLALRMHAQTSLPFSFQDLATMPVNSAESSFTAYGALFNGSTILTHSGNLSGQADGTQATLSIWFDPTAKDSLEVILFALNSNTALRLGLIRAANNTVQVVARNASGSNLVSVASTSTVTASSGVVHVLAAMDTSVPEAHIWLNGVEETLTTTTLTNGTIDLAAASAVQYMANDTAKYQGNMWEFAYYQAFINDPTLFASGGHPKDIGANGATPGATPIIYLSRFGSATNWVRDSSSRGNDFTASGGTLTNPSVTP